MAMLGVGTAVNLQSRFAATDLSEPGSRGRDLAIVVWATTIGAVAGPNLITPGDELGQTLGLPPLGGVFVFTIAAQLVRGSALRARAPPRSAPHGRASRGRAWHDAMSARVRVTPSGVRTAIIALALSHATMASVMAMTPVHLVDHGATLAIVGLTISLHVAGMYGLSPLWGVLSDRVGREPVIAIGQGMLLAALLMTSFGAESSGWVLAGLIFLGLGWSASTVAASGLVTDSAAPARRTVVQGRADLSMSLAGAVGAGGAGVVLALIGYAGLSLVAIGTRRGRARRARPAHGGATEGRG